MPSALTWLDHDPAARERSLRILALFQEKESRDELGLGAIRDGFSDKLFPGTSTIQTRLRYMLIVPWVFQELERRKVPARHFATRARQFEKDLIAPLLDSDDRSGVFGRMAGQRVKRLPSEVYWSGLGAWGIRRMDLSLDEYQRSVDRLYRLRGRRRDHQHDDESLERDAQSWHPKLPPPPYEFPDALDLTLTRDEAAFILDCLMSHVRGSLLAFLARECGPVRADYPWEHPDHARFPPEDRLLLQHARRFAQVMEGAAILYNFFLARIDGRRELAEDHRAGYVNWVEKLDRAEIAPDAWSLTDFWAVNHDPRHRVTAATRNFVERWIGLVRANASGLHDSPEARTLIETRERLLKKARSRFANPSARAQWGGRSGLGMMTYRWPTARGLLNDLYRGLGRR
jgi:hypothetical protein